MLALINHTDRFMDSNMGCIGRVYDARVFQRLGLYFHSHGETLFPQKYIGINGIIVPTVILGDKAYHLLPWIMK